MTKEQIISAIEALEAEAEEIKAEQEAIDYLLSLVASSDSSRADEVAHQAQRRQNHLNLRIAKWKKNLNDVEAEANKLAA